MEAQRCGSDDLKFTSPEVAKNVVLLVVVANQDVQPLTRTERCPRYRIRGIGGIIDRRFENLNEVTAAHISKELVWRGGVANQEVEILSNVGRCEFQAGEINVRMCVAI